MMYKMCLLLIWLYIVQQLYYNFRSKVIPILDEDS